MPRIVQWDRQIGRRLRLRDLFVFSTVVRNGSMAKAAAQLDVTTPSVSEIIADLEHVLGVRLLDRSPQGVVATVFGEALLRRGEAAFDELRQGVRDIEFLADPTSGEVRIGCPDSIMATILPPIIKEFSRQHPRAVLHVDTVPSPAIKSTVLRDRRYDLVLARSVPVPDDRSAEELNTECLFDDPLVVAAGSHTRWARRRKIDLAELVGEQWILPTPGTWTYSQVVGAFQMRGLDLPKTNLVTMAWPLIAHFLADGSFITGCARSLVRHKSLHELPVDLAMQTWSVLVVTLKNRTLSPVVERFIQCAREVAKSMAVGMDSRKTHRRKPNVS
jgi:DNA-binding transcriptional LysR family regulator